MEKNMYSLIQLDFESKARVKEDIERYSVIRTVAAVERCDVAILVIDADRRNHRTGC